VKPKITKPFFPNIQDRLKIEINLTPNFAAMVTVHSKIRALLPSLQDNETSNMSLPQWRSNNRLFALPMHLRTSKE
jgi:hypothetical protein